jgi:hypothetical protein
MKLIPDCLRHTITCRVEEFALRRSNRRGPDFICFGMQKAGTRWLFDQMNAREDVWMPPIKEISFFNRKCLVERNLSILERNKGSLPLVAHLSNGYKRRVFCRHFATYRRSQSGMEWYRRLFDLKGQHISGDITPDYSELEPTAIRRIAREFPRTKFILLIREPVDRVWSALCMDLRKGKVNKEQMTTWETLLPLLEKKNREMKSRPAELWQRWTAEVPSDRIAFWFFDDICTRPQQVVDEICGFLGIKAGPGLLPAKHNRKQGNEKIEMPPHIREKLTKYYAAELEVCATVFGSHAIKWR